MYEYDYDEFESGGTWRTLAIVAAVGLGAYVAYQLWSNPERAKELGRKARDAAKSVADKATSMAGSMRDKMRGGEQGEQEAEEGVDTTAPSGQFA